MSGADLMTGTFHQMQVTGGDAICSVKGILGKDRLNAVHPVKLSHTSLTTVWLGEESRN